MMRRRKRVALMITAVLLAAAACGDDDGADGAGGDEPKGEPIKVMTIGSVGTAGGTAVPAEQVAMAYEGFINDQGGINDRPLEVIYCDDENNPNAAEQCAREAVSQGVAAVLGGFSIVGGTEILAVLGEANIPWFGEGVFGFAAQTDPASYPTVGSIVTQWVALGQLAGEQGCETAGALQWDEPVGIFSLDWFRHGLESAGGEVGPVSVVSSTATDLGPAVAAATDGVDCVAIFLSPEQGPLAVQEIRSAGVDAQLVFYPDAVSEQAVEQTGGADSPAEGGLSASWFPAPEDPVWDEAKQAVEEFAPNPDAVDFSEVFNTQLTWVAYKTFTLLVEGMTTIDGPSVRAALDQADEVESGGFTPPLQFKTPAVPGNFAYSRLFNPHVTLLTIKDGKYVTQTQGFVDTSDLLATYEETPGIFPEGGGGPPGGEGGGPPGGEGGGPPG